MNNWGNIIEKPITQVLHELRNGGEESLNDLLPLVYGELRRLANSYLGRERSNHTLQPTALVHEAYLRLIGQNEIEWQSRAHFFGVSARLMREILIEYARAKNRRKRGGESRRRLLFIAQSKTGRVRVVRRTCPRCPSKALLVLEFCQGKTVDRDHSFETKSASETSSAANTIRVGAANMNRFDATDIT